MDNDALVPDREANERLRNTVGAQHHDFAFRLTHHGLDMLRVTGGAGESRLQ